MPSGIHCPSITVWSKVMKTLFGMFFEPAFYMNNIHLITAKYLI